MPWRIDGYPAKFTSGYRVAILCRGKLLLLLWALGDVHWLLPQHNFFCSYPALWRQSCQEEEQESKKHLHPVEAAKLPETGLNNSPLRGIRKKNPFIRRPGPNL
jgi:hypothetical protein